MVHVMLLTEFSSSFLIKVDKEVMGVSVFYLFSIPFPKIATKGHTVAQNSNIPRGLLRN
jgi:hypothetical protein